jgi:methylglutaconyl-CoA hydratase
MTELTPQPTVRTETLNGVYTVTFFHPQSNALPRKLLGELAQAIGRASEDSDHRVVVLQSSGDRAFCAGASFDELVAIQTPEEGHMFFSGFSEVILAIRACPLLVICRVQGKAVGGGVGLAAAADYTMATQQASIKLSELAVGIGPFVVGPAVERKLGKSAFSSLAMDATSWRSANWGLDHGLYAHVFETSEALDEGVLALSTRLANSSPEAMHSLKQVFWEGTDDWPELLEKRAAISGELVLSDFTRSAIAAFKKR